MKRKYIVDDNLFDSESENSFYLAGFLAADGCINNKNELSIRLSSNDESHLLKLNEVFKSNRPIRNYKNEYTGVSVLRVTSNKIVKDLERFCVIPRKSNVLKFPEWIKNHPLKHHFMRGYFDGDGSFYLNTQYNHKICLSLRGTEDFLLVYRDILEKECKLPHRINKMPLSGSQYQLGYGGNINIIKIANFLYDNATLFLDRKRRTAKYAEELLHVDT